jgi:putative solute:sodium symporter small subunit
MASSRIDRTEYWKIQIRRTLMLLGVWFVAGYGMSIFLAEPLNRITLGGIPFGFWMSQQGSIFVFILLVLVYAITAGQLDRRAGVEEAGDAPPPPPGH